MKPDSRFGGHIVSGHVDGLAKLVSRSPDGRSERLVFSTSDELKTLNEETFLSVFEGVPQYKLSKEDLQLGILDIMAEKTKIFSSKGEARRMIKSNAISINKEKITDEFNFSKNNLINNKYVLVQKGKKNYFLIIVY